MEIFEAIGDYRIWDSRIFQAVTTLVIGVFAIRILMKILRSALDRSKLEKAAHTLVTSLAATVLYILLGLIAASALGIDVSSIVALASVLTLALSLALQNMVSNVIGGFTLLYTRPFHSGDFVEIAGQAGTVQEINMTYTMLSTPDNKMISIPNASVVAAQIINYSAAETRRVEVLAHAGYDVPTAKVIDAMLLAAQVPGVQADPAPMAVIASYGDSAIHYSLRIWVKTAEYWDVYFLITRRVKEIFDQQGIVMTYPHLNVHLEQ